MKTLLENFKDFAVTLIIVFTFSACELSSERRLKNQYVGCIKLCIQKTNDSMSECRKECDKIIEKWRSVK